MIGSTRMSPRNSVVRRFSSIIVLYCAVLAIGALAGQFSSVLPATAVLLVLTVAVTAEPKVSARLLLFALIILSLAPLPKAIPVAIYIAGGSVFLADLVAAAILVLVCVSPLSLNRQRLWTAFFVAIIVFYCGVGVANGATLPASLADARGPIRLFATAMGASIVMRFDYLRELRHLGILISIVSVWTATVVASVAFSGSEVFRIGASNAAVYTTTRSEVYDAIRVTPDSGLTCVVLSAVLICCRTYWKVNPLGKYFFAVVGAGLFVGVLGYTRGHVAVFFFIVLLAMFLRSAFLSSVRLLVVVLATGVASFATYQFAGWIFPSVSNFIAPPLNAFAGRVVDGFSASTIATDSSTQWRVKESNIALEYIRSNWLFGSGFGAKYRDVVIGDIFDGDSGTTYIHSGFLWVLVKTGIAGTAAILGTFGLFAVRTYRSFLAGRNLLTAFSFAVLLCVLTQLISSPTQIEPGNSVLIGLIVAVVVSSWQTDLDSSCAKVSADRKAEVVG